MAHATKSRPFVQRHLERVFLEAEKVTKKISRKNIRKLADGKCFFCPETNANLLDAHRILFGKNGGRYHDLNMVTLCSNCHRRVHAGEIVIDRRYLSTSGKHVLHYWIGGVEFWT